MSIVVFEGSRIGTKMLSLALAAKTNLSENQRVLLLLLIRPWLAMHYDILNSMICHEQTHAQRKDSSKSINGYKLTNPLLEPYGYRDVIGTRMTIPMSMERFSVKNFSGEDCVGSPITLSRYQKRGCYLADGSPAFPRTLYS